MLRSFSQPVSKVNLPHYQGEIKMLPFNLEKCKRGTHTI
jgi:hypothetical protein